MIVKKNNKLSNAERQRLATETVEKALAYYNQNNISLTKLAKMFGLSRTTIHNYMKANNVEVKSTNVHSQDTKFFDVIDSEEKAYWLGFIYADGCISERVKNGKVSSMKLEITLNEGDKIHLEKFLKDIKSTNTIETKLVKLHGKEITTYRATVSSTDMCRDLIRHGCSPRKSLTLEFPKHLPESLVKHFIRGYFDGDGCISTRKRISVVGTEQFLTSLQNYLIEELNVSNVSIRQEKRGKHYSYEKSGNDALKIMNLLYSDCKVYLDRKYEKALAYLQGDL